MDALGLPRSLGEESRDLLHKFLNLNDLGVVEEIFSQCYTRLCICSFVPAGGFFPRTGCPQPYRSNEANYEKLPL